MENIISKIRQELRENVDLEYKKGSINFFKEPIKPYGVRAITVKKIAARYYSQIKNKDKKEIYNLCEELLKSGYMEEGSIAFNWLYRQKKSFQKSDFIVFEKWLKNYITNWAHCDDFCTHAFGNLITEFSELYPKIIKWTSSKNRWLRRASAVIMIYPVKRKKYLKQVFAIADRLIEDDDDLVQKGYGWMLKEASNIYRDEVFKFVIKRKNIMPRTALRYAIEKMPAAMKVKAMKK